MEKFTHYGLADLLGLNAQRLKDKIRVKQIDLEKLGALDIQPEGVELNIDQTLFLVINLTSCEIETRIAFIKALFEINAEEINYKKISESMPVLETIETNKTNYKMFSRDFSKI